MAREQGKKGKREFKACGGDGIPHQSVRSSGLNRSVRRLIRLHTVSRVSMSVNERVQNRREMVIATNGNSLLYCPGGNNALRGSVRKISTQAPVNIRRAKDR